MANRMIEAVKAIAGGATGFGKPTQYRFSQRSTPGGGANPVAFDTLQLPMYTAVGSGIVPHFSFQVTTQRPRPVYTAHGVPVDTLGNPGNLTGQFISQPLLAPPGSQAVPLVLNNVIKEGALS